jgi:hypothetical protein
LTPFKNNNIEEKFNSYPDGIKQKLLKLRELVYEVALEEKSVTDVKETLKWGEPSYVTKNGSTLRIDWKKKNPHHYSMYFNCQTKLIPTFRELFSDRFHFEGNREIVFQEDDIFDEEALRYCILLSLTYHDRKHLHMLDE